MKTSLFALASFAVSVVAPACTEASGDNAEPLGTATSSASTMPSSQSISPSGMTSATNNVPPTPSPSSPPPAATPPSLNSGGAPAMTNVPVTGSPNTGGTVSVGMGGMAGAPSEMMPSASGGVSNGGGGNGGGAGMSIGGAAGAVAVAGSGGQGGSAETYTENPGTEGNGDFTIGPDYTRDPDLEDQGNPKGESFSFLMPLADSAFFDGTDESLRRDPVRTERNISVYVPAAYQDGTAAPFMVIQDGEGPNPGQDCFDIGCRLNMLRNAVDNLTASADPERQLPALILVSVQNGGSDSKGSERGLEYDTMSDRYARFINEEVLPAVLSHEEIRAAYPNIQLTDNPWGRGAIGCSSGAAAVLTMGWFRPDLFRRLITYSGTFVDQQDDVAPEEAMYPFGAWEYHSEMELILNTEKKPLRIATHVSDGDNGANGSEEDHHNWVMAGQRTAEDLAAMGYDYRFLFSQGTGHCDGQVFDETLADTLVWMWRGYHAD